MRALLNWVGLENGLQLAHAAVVGVEDCGVLLAGRGGSGKSTTALACLNDAMKFISDDYCWLTERPEPKAYAVYRTAKLFPEQEADLPLWPGEKDGKTDKTVFDLTKVHPNHLASSLSLSFLLLPRPREVSRVELRPAAFQEAVGALALTTVGQLPGSGEKSIRILQEVARLLPCYHLDLCRPVSAVPGEIRRLLGR
jgi:hypothetical protein